MTELRRIGRSDLTTPPLILGGNVFGWTADQDTGFAVLDAFVAGGGKVIDTADVYSAWVDGHKGGESEAVIGAWLKQRGRRDDVVITTKVGMLPIDGVQGLAPAHITKAVEGSLQRLGTDYIDLYLAHRDDEGTDQAEVAQAFDRLVKKARYAPSAPPTSPPTGSPRRSGAEGAGAGALSGAAEPVQSAGARRL
jgi:aryl-alcohol dehydrogenase-like predicted oxidoreductase